jgi:Arc/MetJ-type ribon-helix-helix transcriptional regulator
VPASITVRLPKELQSQLKRVSREEKVPISDLVRESLQRFLAVRRFRRLRHQTLPFAEAQGLLTDEDIFRAMS